MRIRILKRFDFRQFRRSVFSFLSCFLLLIGIFGSTYKVSAIAGIDDALFWASFTAAGFAGTAGEAALTGKIAHDQYGVHFGSQSQAQDFVQNFYAWAVNGGGLTTNPAGELVNAAGHKIFQTGYKAATSVFSIASLADLSAKLSLYIAGVKTGSVVYDSGGGLSWSGVADGTSFGYAHTTVLSPNTTYVVTCSNSHYVVSLYNYLTYVWDGSSQYTIVTGASSGFLLYNSGTLVLQNPYLNLSNAVFSVQSRNSGNAPAGSFSVTVTPTAVGGNSVCPDMTRVKTTTDAAGDTVADVVGANGDKTGVIDAGVPIGLTTSNAQSIPMDDVIDGDTTQAKSGTLENVQASQLADAADAEAAGDTTVTPDKDWTTKSDEKIDWSPLQNLTVSDRFPFCIPFDLINSISALRTPGQAPVWTLNFPSQYFVGGGSITIDFSKFDTLATIVRWFLTFLFVVALILLTRNLIRG